MSRTRTSKRLAEEASEGSPPPISADDSGTNIIQPPTPSFKDQLTRFQYASTTTSTTAASPSPSPLRSAAKRTRTTLATTTDATTTITTSSSFPRPKKKRKPSSYAPPTKYAHLTPLTDILAPNLITVFVGTNPGIQTATAGHAYAHPSNHFWKLLHTSGLTDRRLKPEEDRSLPDLYCMGNTNIVDRPSKDAAELSKEETSAGTANLDAKFLLYKPESVCIVGKGIWEAIWRYRYGKSLKKGEFRYGWQDEEHNMGKSSEGREEVLDGEGKVWKGASVFVTTSTSGLAASLKPAEKEAIWKPFGEWVQRRRAERGFVPKIGTTPSETEE
ncbi:uracil-DNA glycosylase-like protein [Lophiotrema nucula]|uniref:Uracil-DNA glycosylase-like protein n=1 Tax=Lophiotrema nucula TaxID=690887 RepID=A0A6A5YK26_9PLEO|nr:uracil-DNA glycosylase-like protein [Lophiotrema nucula]